MSEQHIESDAERDARKDATAHIGYDAHGKEVFALFLIDPETHLVQVPIGTKLKSGWRYATQLDYAEKVELELARQGLSAPAPEPEEYSAPTAA